MSNMNVDSFEKHFLRIGNFWYLLGEKEGIKLNYLLFSQATILSL